jgi:exocyst complex component 4
MLEYLETDLGDGPVPLTITHRRTASQTMGQSGSSHSLSSIITSGPNGDFANPEADSFGYIETLLEALAVLGRLGSALETLVQRVPGEIHGLVEATLDEVEERCVL